VVNGHKSAAHTDSLDGDTCNTCLGGGMRCPSVSSFFCNVGKSVTANVQGLNQNGAPLGPTACKLSPTSVRRSEVADHRPVTRGEQAASCTTATSHKSE